MERRTVVLASAVFLVSAFLGFYLASLDSDTDQGFDRSFNYTVDPDDEIVTANFDGKKIDIMRESGQEAKFYLDLDRDGDGFENEGELKDLDRSGSVGTVTRLVNLNDTNYRLYFRYRDDSETAGDGWLTLYRVKRL